MSGYINFKHHVWVWVLRDSKTQEQLLVLLLGETDWRDKYRRGGAVCDKDFLGIDRQDVVVGLRKGRDNEVGKGRRVLERDP